MSQSRSTGLSPEQLKKLMTTSIRVRIEYQYHGTTNHVYTTPSYPFEVVQLLCTTVSRGHGSWKSPDDMSAEDIEEARVNVPQSITLNVTSSVPLWYCQMVFDWMIRYCESGGQQMEIVMPDEMSPKVCCYHHWRLLEAVAMIEIPLMNEVLRSGIRRLETKLSSREDVVACFDNFRGNHPARYSALRGHTHVLLTYKDHGDHQARLGVIREIRDIEDVTGVNFLENWVGGDDALPTDAELEEYAVDADNQNTAGNRNARQGRIRVQVELNRMNSIQDAARDC